MHFGWNIDWKIVSRDLLVVIAAILAALLVHFVFYALLRRLHSRRGASLPTPSLFIPRGQCASCLCSWRS